MSTYNNTPYSTKILEGDLLPKSSIYSIDLNLEVKDNTKYIPRFYGELYFKSFNQVYPIKTKYNAANIKVESFENDKTAPYPIKYELLYRSNGRYIIVDTIDTDNGRADFKNLIKDYTYYVKAIDTSNKYQSKVQKFIPTEYDLEQRPTIISPYKNLSYDKFQYNFIVNNIFGEKTVYLENHKSHIKLEKIDDKRYKVYLSEIKNRADEFDIVLEDSRENEIIKIIEHIYINDGYSEAYDISINFTESGSVIFKWNGDGKIDYYNIYLKGSTNSNGLPITSTGLNTYIANEYPLDKTRYLSIGSVRNGIEKLPVDIVIPGVDPYLDKVELLIFANYGSPIKDISSKNTSFTINGNTTIVNSNKFVDNGALYVDGSGDGIVIPITPLGDSDFTFEYYFSLSSYTGTPRMFEFAESTGYNQLCGVFYNNTNMPYLAYKNNNVWADYGKDIKNIPINEYHHYCVMRKNNVIYYFIDGVLLTKITNTFPLLATHLYLGQSYINSSYITGYYNSIRLTRGVGRYNIDGFTLSDVSITALNKITKPDSLSYDIKANNDLSITINHTNNNVDNYSIYMSDAEITSIDTLTPIAKNTTNKSLVLPNFDVYNNYGKTLKLVATANKYNHQYLSDNKDVYVAYDWTPDNLNCDIYLDANDITTATTTVWKDRKTNAVYNTNNAALSVNTINNNKAIYFNYTSILYCLDTKITDLIKNASNPSAFIVWNKTIDYTDSSDKCIFRFTFADGSNRFTIYSNLYNTNKYGLGGRKVSTNSFVGTDSIELAVKNKIYMTCNEMNINNDYIKLYTDGLLTKQSPLGFQGGVSSNEEGYSNIGGYTTNVGAGNGGGHVGNIFCIIYNKNGFTTDERQKLEGWAAHKYGLTANLPSDHPYKNRKPLIDHTPINLTSEFKND